MQQEAISHVSFWEDRKGCLQNQRSDRPWSFYLILCFIGASIHPFRSLVTHTSALLETYDCTIFISIKQRIRRGHTKALAKHSRRYSYRSAKRIVLRTKIRQTIRQMAHVYFPRKCIIRKVQNAERLRKLCEVGAPSKVFCLRWSTTKAGGSDVRQSVPPS